ncbi:hypothetical protein ACLKA6_014233 [Drosophila palustris]
MLRAAHCASRRGSFLRETGKKLSPSTSPPIDFQLANAHAKALHFDSCQHASDDTLGPPRRPAIGQLDMRQVKAELETELLLLLAANLSTV